MKVKKTIYLEAKVSFLYKTCELEILRPVNKK